MAALNPTVPDRGLPPLDLRLVGLHSSEPEYAGRTTGVGAARHHLFKALRSVTAGLEVFKPPLPNARLGDTHLGRDHRTLKRSPAVFEAKSRATEQFLFQRSGAFDVALQWEFFFAPYWESEPCLPYALYNDFTTRLTQRLMPGWADPQVYEPFHAMQVPLLRQAGHVFCFSDLMRDSVVNDYGVDPARTSTVYTGVNLDRFPEAPLGKSYEPRRVLFVGNDYELKGLPVLLRVLERVRQTYPDVTLDVVGDPLGFSGASYNMAGVTVHGTVADPTRLGALFKQATVFCLPSRVEPFGHVYAEAMAFGLPCVGNRRGAVPEIIDDGVTGCVAEPDDDTSWAEALDLLLGSAQARQRMGAAGYQKAVRLFDWDVVALNIATTLQELR